MADSKILQEADLSDCETRGASAPELYSTDDESTGQGCCTSAKKLHMEVNLEKMISKHKSDSMFELRKLALQHRPVSDFGGKRSLEQHFAKRSHPLGLTTPEEESNLESNVLLEEPAEEPQAEHAMEAAAQNEPPLPEAREEGEEQNSQDLRPEEILHDLQTLQEMRVVNAILQGPVHQEIDRALRESIERSRQQRRPRPRVRPRPQPIPEEGEEGGDEAANPVGRLLAAGGQARRQRGSRGRRARFRAPVPTPNADGRYSVPQRNQSAIVERLRQSPALNSLGVEARDEIVAEVGSLVSQQLVTSALSGEFRGVLELHIQARAEQINRGSTSPPAVGGQPRHHARSQDSLSDEEREAHRPSSRNVRELQEDMVIVKGQLNELKQMMRVSFDLQLDIQRAIRQEVAAALTSFLSHTQQQQQAQPINSGQPMQAACLVPTLGTASERNLSDGNGMKVVESGHCAICSEGIIDSVIYHCGHMCTCIACGLELKSKALKCPICRAPITDVIRAYASMM